MAGCSLPYRLIAHLILFSLLCCAVIYFFCLFTQTEHYFNLTKTLHSREKSRTLKDVSASLKVILYWNTYYGLRGLNLGFGQQPLIEANCPVSSCYFTDDRGFFNRSAAVVFVFQMMNLYDLPTYRLPHQRFVYYQTETQVGAYMTALEDERVRYNFYNWTMTYRMDSDIVERDFYGVVIPRKASLPSWTELSSVIARKSKLIVWIVSHCQTPSKREEYVRQLKRYVPVDVYGSCGKFACPDRRKGLKMMRTNYKFAIAFENSFCPDYVTEKLMQPLVYNTVPIVMGDVDYDRFAPPGSYIDVKHYKSPKHLAEYLHLLDKSDDLYARYFEWKKNYTVTTSTKEGWCRLCAMVHEGERLPVKTYSDLRRWWITDRPCSPGWSSSP